MKLQVCVWKNCKGRFSEYILKRVQSDVVKFWLENIELEPRPCMSFCEMGPNVMIDGEVIHKSDPAKISKIIFERVKNFKKSTPNTKK